MQIIEFNSVLGKGEILLTFRFECDSDVYFNGTNWDVENYGNRKDSDLINFAMEFYNNKYNK